MSLSRGLIIKSGRPTVPQWRLRGYLNTGAVDPGLNTWYDILPVTGDAKINYITMRIGNVDNNWTVRAILDGVTYNLSSFINNNVADVFIYMDPNDAQLLWTTNITMFGEGDFIEFYSARVQFRREANGTAPRTATGKGRYQSL